jgi:hypothetical protein
MATILDLVTESYSLLNHPGEGQSLPATDSANALNILNRLLESLNLRRLIPYYVQRETFSLVSGTQSYTIGTSGTFNTTRPNRILHMTLNSGDNDYPMYQLDYAQWMDIFNKTNQSNIPRWFYYEKAYPLATINIYYEPSDSSSTITIASEKTFGDYALTDTVALPPGYERMIVYNVAKELLPKFPVQAQAPFILKEASSSIDDIERLNMENIMTEMEIDYTMVSGYNSDGRSYFWNGN